VNVRDMIAFELTNSGWLSVLTAATLAKHDQTVTKTHAQNSDDPRFSRAETAVKLRGRDPTLAGSVRS
jgi:hypothetical protein